MQLYPALAAIRIGDRRGRQQGSAQRVDRADVGLGRARAHGNAEAGAAEVDTGAGNELIPSHQVVGAVRRQDGHIERIAGFDPAFEIGGEGVLDHEPLARRAFEDRGDLPQDAARRGAAENLRLGSLAATPCGTVRAATRPTIAAARVAVAMCIRIAELPCCEPGFGTSSILFPKAA